MDDTPNPPSDGAILDADRLADRAAIQDLATAYAHATDDGDWARWESLFLPDALIDYTSAGGIAGTPAEVASWMPGALSIFTFCLHTTATHDISFTGPNTATGRVHVFNRNGVMWDGHPEIVDVGAVNAWTAAPPPVATTPTPPVGPAGAATRACCGRGGSTTPLLPRPCPCARRGPVAADLRT